MTKKSQAILRFRPSHLHRAGILESFSREEEVPRFHLESRKVLQCVFAWAFLLVFIVCVCVRAFFALFFVFCVFLCMCFDGFVGVSECLR